jgi:hypothetical protein
MKSGAAKEMTTSTHLFQKAENDKEQLLTQRQFNGYIFRNHIEKWNCFAYPYLFVNQEIP